MENNFSELAAIALKKDPRIAAAKKLFLEAVSEHQSRITSVCPPKQELEVGYDELISRFSKGRGGKLWYDYIGSGIGNGCLVELLDGSVKYDFIIGIGVHYFGHSHPKIIEANLDAATVNTVMQGNLQQNQESFEVIELLLKASKLDACFLSTSGATANENALKIVFQKRFPAKRLLAFENCFAGRTTTLIQITDKASSRDGLPTTVNVDYIPFYNPKKHDESIQAATFTLKNLIKRYPKDYAAMIFELVQGEGGFYPGHHDFFKAIMDILKENQISIIVDEVQTFGRTSQLFAFQYFELQDYVDVVTIGKLSQVCATIYKQDHQPRPGLLSQTFTASTSALFSGKVIIQTLLEEGFYGENGKISKMHEYFASKLQMLADKYPNLIEGPFGIGAMIAFTPFKGDAKRVDKFTRDLFEAGVLSFTTGTNPTRIRFLVPAGVITNLDIDNVIAIIEQTLLQG